MSETLKLLKEFPTPTRVERTEREVIYASLGIRTGEFWIEVKAEIESL